LFQPQFGAQKKYLTQAFVFWGSRLVFGFREGSNGLGFWRGGGWVEAERRCTAVSMDGWQRQFADTGLIGNVMLMGSVQVFVVKPPGQIGNAACKYSVPVALR
jgi:hypothetical protein